MRGVWKLVPIALAVVLLASALTACGGGGGAGSSPSTSAQAPVKSGEASGESQPGKPTEQEGNSSGGASGGQSSEPKSKPHYEGGEESVEKYGAEAEGSGKEAILSAEHAYLSAIASKDFSEACARLASSVTRSLEQLAAPQLRAKGCPAILPKLLSPTAAATARQQAEGEIKRIRVKGDQAFVIFHAPGARLWVLTMARENGTWKATTIAGSILAPSAATLGTG